MDSSSVKIAFSAIWANKKNSKTGFLYHTHVQRSDGRRSSNQNTFVLIKSNLHGSSIFTILPKLRNVISSSWPSTNRIQSQDSTNSHFPFSFEESRKQLQQFTLTRPSRRQKWKCWKRVWEITANQMSKDAAIAAVLLKLDRIFTDMVSAAV